MTSSVKLRRFHRKRRIMQGLCVGMGIVLLAGSVSPAQAQGNGSDNGDINLNPFSQVVDRTSLVGRIISRFNPDSDVLQGPRPAPVEVPESQQLGGFFRPGINRLAEGAGSIFDFLGQRLNQDRQDINRAAGFLARLRPAPDSDPLTPNFDEEAFSRERIRPFRSESSQRPVPSPSQTPFVDNNPFLSQFLPRPFVDNNPFLRQFLPNDDDLGPGILNGDSGSGRNEVSPTPSNTGSSGSSGTSTTSKYAGCGITRFCYVNVPGPNNSTRKELIDESGSPIGGSSSSTTGGTNGTGGSGGTTSAPFGVDPCTGRPYTRPPSRFGAGEAC